MSEFEPRSILLQLFLRLRRQGFPLGLRELLDGYRALNGGWGASSPESLRQITELLWCRSRSETEQLVDVFATLLSESAEPPPELPPKDGQCGPMTAEDEPLTPDVPSGSRRDREPVAGQQQMTGLPVRTPPPTPEIEETFELHADWPLRRRSMIYGWHYLRRPVADGPRDVLDVEATVQLATRQGFFLQPSYRRRERNHAHLLLMVDQGGSMVPFHRFTRDLVQTACEESSLEQVDTVYFHNVPPPSVYRDPHLTEPVPLQHVLDECSPDTSILIVSDAGAARGFRVMRRARDTTAVLHRLRRTSSLLAWLNPVPRFRWPGTTAQILARLVPMFAMTPDGLSNAVDVLAGRSVSHER